MPKIGDRFSPYRMFSGIFIPDAIFHYPNLPIAAKLLYGRLCRYAGEHGHAYPSITKLASELQLSDRQVQRHIKDLIVHDFIEIEEHPGKSSTYYFLWHPCFGEDAKGVTFMSPPPGTGDINVTPSGDINVTPVVTFMSPKESHRRESEEESQFSPLPPSPPSTAKTNTTTTAPKLEGLHALSDGVIGPNHSLARPPGGHELDLDDDVITFVRNIYRRVNRRAKLGNLRVKTSELLCQQIQDAEEGHGRFEFRRALVAYLQDLSDWLQGKRWPIRVFLRQIDSYEEGGEQNGRSRPKEPAQRVEPPQKTPREGGSARGRVAPRSPGEKSEREVSQGGVLPAPPQPSLPALAEKWNELVPSGEPVQAWTRRDRKLEGALADPDFLANSDGIFETCEKIIQKQGSKAKWLTFRWLLRHNEEADTENWYRIHTREFTWMMERKSAGRMSKADEAIESALRRYKK